MRKFTFIFFIFSSWWIQAQQIIAGKILDQITGEALENATILFNNQIFISGEQGDFSFIYNSESGDFKVSFVGYEPQIIKISTKEFYDVKLVANAENITEIKIKENPAITIIRNAISKKNNNNPEKKLKSYKYESYNKLKISANPDSISGKLDSVFVTKKGIRRFLKLDSTQFKFKKLIDKQHLYQTEKISEYYFDGKNHKEQVLGTKMAGFKHPIYELLGLKLQSVSVYNNIYNLLETKYINPVTKSGLQEYQYQILDTISLNNREVVLINFRPRSKNVSNKISGVIYIDIQNFAIAKMVVRAKNIINITAVHYFDYFPKHDLWFSSKNYFKVTKGESKSDINILGNTIQFQEPDDPIKSNLGGKYPSDYIYIVSETTQFNHQFNEISSFKKPSVLIDIPKNAIEKDENFWDKYRKDSLDQRELQTYVTLDSLIVKEGIEQKLRIGRKLLNGYIPVSIFDFDLRYLVKYNNHEGFRFGLGGITNEKFSEIFRIDGYTAYGLKDESIKYSIGSALRVGQFSNSWFGFNYTDDVQELASTKFDIDKRVFKLYDPRPINLSTFYNHKTWKGYVQTLIIPRTESLWQLSQSNVTPLFNYTFVNNGQDYKQFNLTTAMVSLQWNPFSDYMQTPNGRLEIEKRFPKFTFQYTQTLDGVAGNDFNFGKIDFRAEYQKKYINQQKTSLYFEFGYAFGAAPLTHLYSTNPNSLTKDNILQRITISGKNSFETMYFNEFFSSKYASFQFKHAFPRIKLFEKVKPSLVLVTRFAIGEMENYFQHQGFEYKTLDAGYIESGIELNRIYKVIGLSAFYRYGPNQLPRFEDNLSIKLNFNIELF